MPAEFHQRLPLVAPVTFDEAQEEFRHTERERRWSLRLIDPRQRRLGNLRLPIVDVELTFEGYASAEIDAFMARFHAPLPPWWRMSWLLALQIFEVVYCTTFPGRSAD